VAAVADQATPLGIEVSGFTGTDFQATVILVDSAGSEVNNGVFTIPEDKRVSLTALTGRSNTSGASLGFSGLQANVEAALEAVTWTPSTAQTGLHVQVSMLPKLDDNVYYNDTNGRYYEHVPAANTSWSAARTAAEGRTLFGASGLQGYLVHISDAQENQFIANNITAADIWIGATDDGDEGKWRWDGTGAAGVTIGTQRAGEAPAGSNELGFVFDRLEELQELAESVDTQIEEAVEAEVTPLKEEVDGLEQRNNDLRLALNQISELTIDAEITQIIEDAL
jgi:hypothetical protein